MYEAGDKKNGEQNGMQQRKLCYLTLSIQQYILGLKEIQKLIIWSEIPSNISPSAHRVLSNCWLLWHAILQS